MKTYLLSIKRPKMPIYSRVQRHVEVENVKSAIEWGLQFIEEHTKPAPNNAYEGAYIDSVYEQVWTNENCMEDK